MCRFAVYLGPEIRISSLTTEPVNSIIHQSFHSHERSEPLNGDGFGIAWYPPSLDEDPAVVRSTTPAWSNNNLKEIARVTGTRCLLAHVRAATPGLPVTELNCHPFAAGRLTFMHNGELGGFRTLRRRLLAGLSDRSFASIQGSTDSEHLFAILLDRLGALGDDGDPTERLARALEATIGTAETLRLEAAPDEPSLLNLVACDGARAVVTRYSSGHVPANSLYVSTGRTYVCEGGICRMADQGAAHTSVIVASEPLDEGDHWTRVEPGHVVLVTPESTVSSRPLVI
jgi:glutamine amidotransferase